MISNRAFLLFELLEYGYGDIYSRESLDKRYRQIATIAALTTLGNAPSQLNFHIRAGLNIGLAADEIKEVMLLMSVYAGFPAAINGMNVLKEKMIFLNHLHHFFDRFAGVY